MTKLQAAIKYGEEDLPGAKVYYYVINQINHIESICIGPVTSLMSAVLVRVTGAHLESNYSSYYSNYSLI